MKNSFRNKILLVLIAFFGVQLYAQNYADKKYYLIDSLSLNELSSSEIKLIDSSLISFYNTKQDTTKAKIINKLIVYLPNEKVWSKYNNWLYEFTAKKLADSSQLHPKEKRLLINIKALVLNTKGYMYNERSEKDKALVFYSESLELLKKIKDKDNTAAVLNNIGAINRKKGKIALALSYYQRSLKIRQTINDKKGIAYVFNNIGLIHRNNGDDVKALEYYFKSLSILEEINDKHGEVALLNNLGGIYQSQGDYLQAIKYFKKSLNIKEVLGDKKGIAISLNRLGFIHYIKGDTVIALANYNKSLVISSAISDKEGIAKSLSFLGKLFLDKKDIGKALECFKKSLEINKEIQNKEGVAIAFNNIASLYIEHNNVLKAKTSALRSLNIAQELRYPLRIKNAAATLNKIYVIERNWKKAYEMKSLSVVIQDSLRSIETEKNASKQQSKYEIGKKEQEITLLSTRNKVLLKEKELQKLKLSKNRTRIILISIALVLALILSAVIHSGNKRKKIIYELLKKQKEEITIKNDEKTAMLKEIHHRVKNNLQVVISLLRLQASKVEDEKVVEMFKNTQKRIFSMALLRESLLQEYDLELINVREHFKRLSENLINSYAVDKKIKLEIDIEEIDLGMQTLTPLGLIINEVITNSLKYAFNEMKQGEISIAMKRLQGEKFEIKITDNGSGYSKNIEHNGMGTKLVSIFVKKLNGSLEFLEQKGTAYKIIFEEIECT